MASQEQSENLKVLQGCLRVIKPAGHQKYPREVPWGRWLMQVLNRVLSLVNLKDCLRWWWKVQMFTKTAEPRECHVPPEQRNHTCPHIYILHTAMQLFFACLFILFKPMKRSLTNVNSSLSFGGLQQFLTLLPRLQPLSFSQRVSVDHTEPLVTKLFRFRVFFKKHLFKWLIWNVQIELPFLL